MIYLFQAYIAISRNLCESYHDVFDNNTTIIVTLAGFLLRLMFGSGRAQKNKLRSVSIVAQAYEKLIPLNTHINRVVKFLVLLFVS